MIPFFVARNGVFSHRAGLSFPRQGGPYPEKWSDQGATVYEQWDKLGRELGEGAGGQVTREIAKGLGVLCPESTQCRDVMSPDTWRIILQG